MRKGSKKVVEVPKIVQVLGVKCPKCRHFIVLEAGDEGEKGASGPVEGGEGNA